MSVKFGSAGNPDGFYNSGRKHSFEMPEYLNSIGLDAYEYQCGRGVNLGAETAEKIRAQAEKYGISMSIHSPYFISLSTTEQDKAAKNIKYITDSAVAVKRLGGKRVVVHSGSCSKVSREAALEASKKNLIAARIALDEMGLEDIILCPETMGKINQLGTLEEVLELCKTDERMIPCIDFGHLNARTLGGIKNSSDYEAILDKCENEIGRDRTAVFHSHFSRIEYSKGGEVKHLTFEDSTFGPFFEDLAEIIAKRGYVPTFISESAGTQDIDALSMKKDYLSKL